MIKDTNEFRNRIVSVFINFLKSTSPYSIRRWKLKRRIKKEDFEFFSQPDRWFLFFRRRGILEFEDTDITDQHAERDLLPSELQDDPYAISIITLIHRTKVENCLGKYCISTSNIPPLLDGGLITLNNLDPVLSNPQKYFIWIDGGSILTVKW